MFLKSRQPQSARKPFNGTGNATWSVDNTIATAEPVGRREACLVT